MAQANVLTSAKSVNQLSMIGAPLILIALLAMLVIPLSPWVLDMFFTFNIALSLIVILSVIYINKPLDFSAFPTVLLITTLMRLALNIASTRVVLLDGHTGTNAAGEVIEAFGDFVVGGNYAVGLVVFSILVIINFVVVTKGAGRISEVTARFTLDAMPGKQMAIDADLNAGVLTQEEAKLRREMVVTEADFYGSMDGASKFVRGDAIAGILILFINIVGGISIGMMQHSMDFGEAVHNYTLLTIGDGLVAQLPSLILSTAAAVMVTRVSSDHDMGGQVFNQMFENPRTLGVTAVIIGIPGLIPGMPNVVFLLLAAACGLGAYFVSERNRVKGLAPSVDEAVEEPEPESKEMSELSWDDVTQVDTIGLEVGYKLIPLVDTNQGGQLMARIKGIRKKLTQDLGFLIPAVHIRDNLELKPNEYRVTLLGVELGTAEIYAEKDMAINPGQVFGELQGLKAKDPAFGMEATWIEPGQRDHAQSLGYTVVDASTAIATHLSQLLQTHAHELLGREEVQKLLDKLSEASPKLVEGLVPEILSLGILQKVLRNLIEDQIPIRDMRTIVETLASEAPKSQDADVLTAAIRVSLSRLIVGRINTINEELPVITLDPSLEQLLQESIRSDGQGSALEPGLADRLHQSLAESVQKQEMAGQPSVLLVSPVLRPMMARFVKHTISDLYVLSFNELPDQKQIRIVASVGRTE